VSEEIDALREVLAFAFEASLTAGQAQQTVIARRLAAWAAILAVPTAIAGIYGMNFEHMPETLANSVPPPQYEGSRDPAVASHAERGPRFAE
jgi:Mg2+ and Co2+ transporter CorA